MIFVAVGAMVGELAIPIIDTFVSSAGWQGQRLGRILPVVAVSSVMLSPLFIPLGRWCLAIRRKTWKVPTQ